MARPRGEIRIALLKAAEELHAEQGGGTWREMACRAQVGFALAHSTIKNMQRAGDVVACGERLGPPPGRRLAIYRLADEPETASKQVSSLSEALAAWR